MLHGSELKLFVGCRKATFFYCGRSRISLPNEDGQTRILLTFCPHCLTRHQGGVQKGSESDRENSSSERSSWNDETNKTDLPSRNMMVPSASRRTHGHLRITKPMLL